MSRRHGERRPGWSVPVRRLALRNWPVAAKLGAVLIVPLATALLLSGLRIAGSLDTAGDYDRVGRLADRRAGVRARARLQASGTVASYVSGGAGRCPPS